MKSRLALRLALVGSILACAILAFVAHAARSRGAALTSELSALRSAQRASSSSPASQAAAATSAAGTGADARSHPERAQLAAALEAARRIPEVARRELALRAINEIKAQHELAPPPARPLPPPMPKNAAYFAELLNDPEYLRLVNQRWQLERGGQTDARLAAAGVPEAVRRQVMQAEFDTYAAGLDIQRYAGASEAERRAALAARADVQRENDARIRELIGDEAFAAYRRPEAPDGVRAQSMVDRSLEPLAMRLSYSETPLDDATRARLAEVLTAIPSSPGQAYMLSRTSAGFVESARAVLQPMQVAALQELQEEYQAARARAQLPKSSELPRTTRRERREAKP